MADYKATTFFLIMISINVVFWMGQSALAEENSFVEFFNVSSSPVGQYVIGDSFVANYSDFELTLEDNINPDTGNIFTDIYKSIKSWFDKQNSRFELVTNILGQPYGFLKEANAPAPITAAFAVIWYILISISLMGMIRGSNQ